MHKLSKIAALPLIAIMLMTASPAKAQYASEATQLLNYAALGQIVSSAQQLYTFISGTLNTIMNNTQNAAVGQMAAQFTSAKLTIEGMARINDVNSSVVWGIANAQAQAQAASQTRPSVTACQPMSGSRAIVANTLPDSMNTDMMLDGALSRANNRSGENTNNGTFAGQVMDFQYRQAHYGECSETDPGNTNNCVESPMPNADVRADTLFGQDTFSDGQPNGSAISASATNWETAAQNFCLNATETSTLNPLRGDLLMSPQGLSAHIMRKAGDARMQLSQMVCFELISERMPGQNSTWGKKIYTNLQSQFGLPMDSVMTNATQNGALSTYQMLKAQTYDQFADINWQQMVASETGPTQGLKLVNSLQAASLQMQWREYEMLERLKLLHAVSLAIAVEKTRLDTSVSQSQ